MGTLASPNLVLPLIDLSTGGLDTGETVELVLHGNAYPGGAIATTEIGATGYYKIETAGGVAALPQGIYEVYVGGVFKAVFQHGYTALQDHADSVADPHSMAAAQVSIVDAGAYISGTDVEAAIQELGAALAAKADSSGTILTDNSSQSVDAAKPVVTNLNADKVDGRHAGAEAGNVPILDASGDLPLSNIPATLTGKDADSVDGRDVGQVAGDIPELGSSAGQLDTSLLGMEVGTGNLNIPQLSTIGAAGKISVTLAGKLVDSNEAAEAGKIPINDNVRHRTSTLNQGDSPDPDLYGGGTIWADQAMANDTNAITLDDSINWRDRMITILGRMKEDGADVAKGIPGGAEDNNIVTGIKDVTPDADLAVGLFYSESGRSGAGTLPGWRFRPSAGDDYLYIWADSTSGDLMIGKQATANGSRYAVVLKIDYSPDQQH